MASNNNITSSSSSSGRPLPLLPRPVTPTGPPPASAFHNSTSRLSFGVVCSSNINRSMEAHVVLTNAHLRVASYGTGTTVRLPGRTAMEPRIFKFGTPYADMYAQLSATPADAAYFARNGVLALCQRGAAVKVAPTRWQDCPTSTLMTHNVVIAFEERIFDAVIEDLLLHREPTENFAPIHVICLDTKDNPAEAAVSGQVCLDLCWRLEHYGNHSNNNGNSSDDDDDLTVAAAAIVDEFQQERAAITPIKVLYQMCYL